MPKERIEPTYLNSENLDAIGWSLETLYIRFKKTGESYSYAGVPYDYFDALQKVESAGKFFHQFIRRDKNIRYTKLDSDPFVSA